MDLFSKNENKSHKGTEEITSCEIKGKRNTKILFDFKQVGTFKHGDIITNLIQARMLEAYERGQNIAPDTAKYICFEIPLGMSIQDLIQNDIFSILNQVGKLETTQENKYHHIGTINKTPENKYELFPPTIEVLKYVDGQMNTKLQEDAQLLVKRIQNFRKRISEPAQEYIIENEKKREARKENPVLEEQFKYKIGDKIYQDYKGIDIVDGKILEINRLNIICTTPETTLYSAYIQKTDKEQKDKAIALQNMPDGFPILFTLSSKIEELLQNENIDGMQSILKLLSNSPKYNFTKNEIQYIGGIDKNGAIYENIELCSETIKNEIDKRKQEHAKLEELVKEDK